MRAKSTMTGISPTLAEFQELALDAHVVPLSLELVADVETPVSSFKKLDRSGHSFLFESTEKNEVSGRFSFLGVEPGVIFQSKGRDISITRGESTSRFQTSTDPLSELRRLMSEYRFAARPDLPRFAGGAVGFIAYDVVRFFEPTVPAATHDDIDLPEMIFMITGALLIFDHRFRTLKIVANAFLDPKVALGKAYEQTAAEIQRIAEQLGKSVSLPIISAAPNLLPREPRSNMSRDQFEGIVAKAQEHIRAGDVFQVVLSQRFETEFQGDPLDLYRALRFVNPSPYMFCLKFGDNFSLVGSSPEMHVRVSDRGDASARPDAGGRRKERSRVTYRSKGARRTRHACRSCAERSGTHRRVRHRSRDGANGDRTLQPRHAHRFACCGEVAARQGCLRGNARDFSGRDRLGRAQSARDDNQQRVGKKQARLLRRHRWILRFRRGARFLHCSALGRFEKWPRLFSSRRRHCRGFEADGGVSRNGEQSARSHAGDLTRGKLMTAAAKSQERTGWELEMQTWRKATRIELLIPRAKVTASALGLVWGLVAVE